jgi:tetratricopeptide (TPR) repeat protein
MTTERFVQVEGIVTEALASTTQDREALIEAKCGGDPELAGEVRALLDACVAEEQLMEECRRQPSVRQDDRFDQRRVGLYRIDRLLGRGGMGSVWLAHRDDGQFEQKVAIKLIDVPLASELFQERFRQERQILAGLQHPYIAGLLDGGVTSTGELYLAMEFVDGQPIHRFCEKQNFSEAQRIRIFLRVCEAVQFAHQNFVVHRDLKPDNILVAEDGNPRLLDFGTAKILSPSPGDPRSQLTREGFLSFTPQYASPEQILGNPITTATDTYSLGVLLYLLLTGSPPYELKELTTAEMLRVVCEESPRRPSRPDGSGGRLEPDLEAILLKSLRKEPQERYLTVERLSGDLRAYLDGHPVAARRDTPRYRASKFMRRHRWGLIAVAILIATLLAGLGGVLWQAQVADRERRMAEARSTDLRQLSNTLLSELDETIKQLPGSTAAQKMLVTRVLERLDRLAGDARADRQTQLDLANAYTRLGNLQGNAYEQDLGDSAGALVSLDKAIALASFWSNRDSADSPALHALASAQFSRGQVQFGTAPIQQAIASSHAAIASYDRLLRLPGVTPGEICEAAVAYSVLGDELGIIITESLNDLPAANNAYRQSLELYNKALSMDPHSMLARKGLIRVLLDIIPIEKESDPEQALQEVQLGLQRIDALPIEDQKTLRMIRMRDSFEVNEAFALAQLGKYSEANALLARSVESALRRVTADPQDLRSLGDLAFSLDRQAVNFEIAADSGLGATAAERQRNLALAEKPLIQELSTLENILTINPSQREWLPVVADVQVRLGSIQLTLHKRGDAAQLVRRGLSTLREFSREDADSPEILDTTAKDLLIAKPLNERDPMLAVSCAERAVALSHRRLPARLLTLAQAWRAASHPEKSRVIAKEALELLPRAQEESIRPRLRRLLEAEENDGA